MADTLGTWCGELIELTGGLEDETVQPSLRSALLDALACVSASGSAGVSLGAPDRLAVAIHRRDLDDVHWPSRTHPGGIIWPIVLHLATGPSTLRRAALIGYEATVDIGACLRSAPAGRWHATSIAGMIGGAVAAAVALDRADVASDAAGHAASVVGGLARTVAERSGTALFHRSHAVTTAIAAARSAVAGLRATPAILEGPGGLADALQAPELRAPRVGSTRPIEELWFRSLPTSGFNHAAFEAARSLGPLADRVDRVDVFTSPLVVHMGRVGVDLPERGWWDLRSAVTTALGDTAASQDIRIHESDDFGELGASVVVTLADGTRRSAKCRTPLGLPPRALSDAQILQKADDFGSVPSAEVARTADAILHGEPFDGGPIVRPINA